MGLHHDTEHRVAGSETVHAGADGFDEAGEVLAEHDRVAVLHHADEHSVGDGEVEAVDGTAPDPDQHFTFGGAGCGQVD